MASGRGLPWKETRMCVSPEPLSFEKAQAVPLRAASAKAQSRPSTPALGREHALSKSMASIATLAVARRGVDSGRESHRLVMIVSMKWERMFPFQGGRFL